MGKPLRNIRPEIRLGIALQGAGSYSVFAKGAMEVILEADFIRDPSTSIVAVSGTSGGAANGALITYGLNTGGPEHAVELLGNYWDESFPYDGHFELVKQFSFWALSNADKWPNIPVNPMAEFFVPADGSIPKMLKDRIDRHIPDWNRVQKGQTKLFVNALKQKGLSDAFDHVVFTGKNINADAIAASGSLKEFGAHEFGGERYLDGAYFRNPSLRGILQKKLTDLLIVTLHARPEGENLRQAFCDERGLVTGAIHHRLTEIETLQTHGVNIHTIELEPESYWNSTSRMNTHPQWLETLTEMGREAARNWLEAHSHQLGSLSSYVPLPAYVHAA